MCEHACKPEPPDPNQPWAWIDGRWWLVILDATDGVPDDLSYVNGDEETERD